MSDTQTSQTSNPFALEGILAYTIKIGASDVHFAEGEHIAFRVHGELGKLPQAGILSHEAAHVLVQELYRGDTKKADLFLEKRDSDFAYVSTDGTPFRVNGFFKLGKIGFVLRRIERESKKMEDLGLPPGVSKVLTAKQ